MDDAKEDPTLQLGGQKSGKDRDHSNVWIDVTVRSTSDVLRVLLAKSSADVSEMSMHTSQSLTVRDRRQSEASSVFLVAPLFVVTPYTI